MPVNATTKERVKALLPKTGGSDDDYLDSMIAAVSREVEAWIGYELELKERTEFYDLQKGAKLLFLRHVPVVSIGELKITPEGWDFASATPLEADVDYRLTPGAVGRISFFVRPYYGCETVQIRYTAGLGANTAALIVAAPEISAAVEMQVAEEFRRRNSPSSEMRTGAAGGSRAFTGHHRLLPRMIELLEPRRRMLA